MSPRLYKILITNTRKPLYEKSSLHLGVACFCFFFWGGVTGWLGALFFNIFKWAFFMDGGGGLMNQIQVVICFLQEMAE